MSLTTAEQYPPVVLGHEKSRYVRIVREEDGVHVYVPEHLLPDAGKKGVEEETGVMAAHGWKATFDAAKGKLYFSKLSDRKEKCWTLPAYAAASSAASASTSASEKKTKKKAKTTGATKSSTKKTTKSLSKTKASGASSLDMGDFSLPYRRAAQTAGDGDDEDDEDDEDNNNNKNSNSSGDDDEAGAIYEKASSTIAANPFHPMSGDPSSEQYETHPLAGALNFGEYDDDDRDVIENNIHGRVLDAHPMPFFSRGGQQPPSPPPQEFYHDRTPPTGLTSPTSHNDALVEQDVAPRASVLLRHREESDTINTFDDGLPPESSPMPNASSSSMMMVPKDTASHQRPMEPHTVTVAPLVIEALTMDEEFAREDIEMGEGSDRDVIVYEALAERDEISFRQPQPAVSQAANSAVAASLSPPQPPKYGYDVQQTIHQDDVQRPRNNTHYSSSPGAVVTGPASSWSASKPEGRGADMDIVQSLADLILSESHEFERREATVSRELAILLQKRALELQEQQQQEVSSRLPSAHADEQQTQQEPPQPLPSFVVPTLTTDGSVIRTAAEDYSGEQRTPLEDLLAQIANEEDDGEFQQQQSLRSRPANSTVAASTVVSDALPPLTTTTLLSSPPSSPRGASEDEASLFPPSCRALAAHLRMDSLQLAAHPEFRHEYVHDAVEHPEHHAGGMIPHFDTHNADISRKVHSGDGHPIVCSPTTISTESAVFQPTATATSTSNNNAKDVENIWSGRVSSQASRFTDSSRSSAAADAPPPSARRRTAVLIEEPLSVPEKHIINNIVQPEQQQQQSATTPATASQSLSIQKPTDSPSLGPEFESGSDGSPTFANTNYASFRRPLRNVKDSFYIAKHPNDRHEYIQQHTSHTTTAGGSSALQYHHDDSGDDSVTSPLGSSNPFRNLKDSVVFSRDVEGHTKYVQDQSNTMSMLSAKEWRAVEAQRQQLLEQATGATRLAPLEEQLNTSKVLERLQRLKDSTSAAAAHVTFISSSGGGAAAADDGVIAGHHLPTTATAASSSPLISSVSLHPTFVDQTAATQQQPILLRKDEELRRLHEAARAYLTSAAVGDQNSKGNNGVRLPHLQQSAPPPASLLTNADALLEHRLEAVMSRLLIQDSLYLYQEALDAKLLESANWSLEAMRIFQRFLETMPPKTKTIAVQASEVTSDSGTSTKPEPPLSTPTAPVGIATSSTSTTSMQVNDEQRLPRQDEEVVVHQPHASRWWPEKEEYRRGASGSPPPRKLLQSEEIHASGGGIVYANYDEDHEYQARIDRIRALQQYEPQQQRSEAVRSGVPRELYERGSRRTLTPALPDALKRPGAGSAMDRSSPSYPLRMQTAFPMTPDASDLAARRGNTGTRVEPAAYTPSSVAAWEATPPPPLGSGTPLTRPLNHEQAAFLRWDVKRSGNVLISQTGTVTMADSSRALKAIQADEAQRAQQQKVTIPMFALGTIGISQGDFVFEIRCELLPSHEALPTTSKFSSSRSPLVANGALKPGQRAPVHRCFVGVASKYYRGPTRTTPAYLYGSDGTILASASDTVGVPYGARWHTQAVVTVHLSFSRRELSFAVDGVPQGVAFKFQRQDDPEPLFPLVVFHGDGDSCAFQPPSLSLSPPRNVNRGLDWRVLSTPN